MEQKLKFPDNKLFKELFSILITAICPLFEISHNNNINNVSLASRYSVASSIQHNKTDNQEMINRQILTYIELIDWPYKVTLHMINAVGAPSTWSNLLALLAYMCECSIIIKSFNNISLDIPKKECEKFYSSSALEIMYQMNIEDGDPEQTAMKIYERYIKWSKNIQGDTENNA